MAGTFFDIYILSVHSALTIVLLLGGLVVWTDGEKVEKHLGVDSITRQLLTSAYFAFGIWSLTAFPFFFWQRTWRLYLVSVTSLFELVAGYCITALLGIGDAEDSIWVAHAVTLVLTMGGAIQIYYGGHVSFLWEE